MVLSTQWSVADGCAAEMVLEFVDKMHNGKCSPAEALTAARDRVRRMTDDDILKRLDEAGKLFDAGSLERAKVDASRAWICWRAGLIDEVEAAAQRAAPVFREAGLFEDNQSLVNLCQASRSGIKPVKQDISYDSPVYWGAFQLLGRAV